MERLPNGIRRRGRGFIVSASAGGIRRRERARSFEEAAQVRARLLREVQAQADAAGLDFQVKPAGPGVRSEQVPGTVAACLARLVDRTRAHGRRDSLRTVERVAELLGLHLGDREAASLSTADVDRYLSERRERVSVATVAHEARYLKAALRLAVAEKVLPAMPCEVKIPREDKQPETLTPEEARRVLAEAPEYLRALLTFAALTGWRSGEVRALSWNMVDMRRGVATIRANPAAGFPGPKGRRERVVFLAPAVLDVLRAQAERVKVAPGAPVFPARRGGYWNRERLAGCVRGLLEELGLKRPGLRPMHGLRALYINTALRNGAHLRDVAEAVGHREATTTLRYLRATRTPSALSARE
jgi:integrase